MVTKKSGGSMESSHGLLNRQGERVTSASYSQMWGKISTKLWTLQVLNRCLTGFSFLTRE